MHAVLVVVMGVSGSGKTTLSQALALSLAANDHLSVCCLDADDFHTLENRRKMQHGTPLNDADREPWLGRLTAAIKNHQPAVVGKRRVTFLACSALKRSHRDSLRQASAGGAVFVYLSASYDLLQQRLLNRQITTGHFMPAMLLQSQFDTLEPPSPLQERDVLQVELQDAHGHEKDAKQLIGEVLEKLAREL